ncbi:MAG: TolC family outer membrane protein [Magnetococcales bacterium]|nr:TolC family outer membrane protein [Magnetococcales bacterium]NGZ06519.1 TolC family outer membrane protein [Magnetococcales bacterium]
MKRTSVTTVLIFFLCWSRANSAWAITLSDAVNEALRTHPKFLSSGQELEESKQKINQAFSGYLPTIDFNMSKGREWLNTPTTRGTSDSGLTMERGEAGMNINQPIFDGFNTVHKLEQAKAQVLSAEHSQREVAENVTLDVALAYAELLKQRRLHELAKEATRLHAELLSKTRQTHQLGISAEMDNRLAESRLTLVESELSASEGQIRIAESHFATLIGMAPTGTLTQPMVEKVHLPQSREEALEHAMRQHPGLLAAKADLEATQAESKATSATLWPRISLDMSVSESNNAGGTRSYSQDASAMLQLRYNLFRGGSDASKYKESTYKAARFQDKMQEIRLQIEEKLNRSWNALTASQARKQNLERHLETTRAVNRDHQEQHRLGSETLLDLLNSETELQAAKRLLVEEEYQHLMESFRLLAAMGKLKETLLPTTTPVAQDVAQSQPEQNHPSKSIPAPNVTPLSISPEEAMSDLVDTLFPTEPATPASAASAPQATQYTIQIAVFPEESTAIQLIGRLQNKGYDIYLQEVPGEGNKPWFRVSIGRLASEHEVQQLLKQFTDKEGTAGFIIPVGTPTHTPTTQSPLPPAAQSSTEDGYAVQVAAYQDPLDTDKKLVQLTAQGHDLYLCETRDANGRAWQMIWIGRFADIHQARSAADAYSRATGEPAHVIDLKPTAPGDSRVITRIGAPA